MCMLSLSICRVWLHIVYTKLRTFSVRGMTLFQLSVHWILTLIFFSFPEIMLAPYWLYQISLSSNWQVLKMESQVLNYLAFQLSSPTAKSFLRYFFFPIILHLHCLWPLCNHLSLMHILLFTGDSYEQHKPLTR